MQGRRKLRVAALALALAAACLWAIPAGAGTSGAGSVRVGSTGDNAELLKTVPIGKRADAKRRVVMSLGAGQVGELRDGDRLEGLTEVEVTVCLKKNPLHPGPGSTCVGKPYSYNPKVKAQLVLADSASASSGGSTVPVSDPVKKRCTQRLPHRNHHCVLVIDDGRLNIDESDGLPCDPADCHLNLVLSAYNRDAKRGHRLVIGSVKPNNRVNGDQGAINSVTFRPGSQGKVEPIVGQRRRSRLPLGGEGQEPKKRVVYSARIASLDAGDQIVVEGAAVARINHLSYSAFMTTQVVLAESPGSVKNDAPVNLTATHGRVSKGNGFNCTQGSSAHKTPCVAKKVGVLDVVQNRKQAVYVNVVSGMRAQFPGWRHRKGHKAKLTKQGFLHVYRYRSG